MSHNRINISFNGSTINSLNDIDEQIKKLQDVKAGIESNALDALNWYDRLSFKHKFSCYKTEEIKKTYSMFKRGFKGYLQNYFKLIQFKPRLGHFFISGFFELENKENGNKQIYYFSIEDLRGGCKFMIRTVKDFKDYTGGSNNYLSLKDFEQFNDDLDIIVRFSLK
jgi:hypothetical protein